MGACSLGLIVQGRCQNIEESLLVLVLYPKVWGNPNGVPTSHANVDLFFGQSISKTRGNAAWKA